MNLMEKSDVLLVKNYQSDETIRKMYEKAFNKSAQNLVITILRGGLKNAVYLIQDGEDKIVLKIGSTNNDKILTIDRNTLWWEAEILKTIERLDAPTPTLLYFDNSFDVCNAPYIFMSYLEGENFFDKKKQLSIDELAKIEYELGQISFEICSIKSNKFFLPSSPNTIFSDNYDFISHLFELLIRDAETKNMRIDGISFFDIISLIECRRKEIMNISNLCLTHCDLWDGNILVNDGKVSGVLDFSDLYFGDELMTFYFHTVGEETSKNYLMGFNEKRLSYDECVRIEIYRLYTLLKMMVDVEFKGYGRYS